MTCSSVRIPNTFSDFLGDFPTCIYIPTCIYMEEAPESDYRALHVFWGTPKAEAYL